MGINSHSETGIIIRVKTAFSELQSDIEHEEYFFVYHIIIENRTNYSMQLLSRKWFIYDSNGENRFVEGEGVVGEQPVIEPGSTYTYYSGCLLKSGFGKMKGTYLFLNHNTGETFDAVIPEFHMVLPWVLN
jgi:ApaG protein